MNGKGRYKPVRFIKSNVIFPEALPGHKPGLKNHRLERSTFSSAIMEKGLLRLQWV
jgi:hypothetical protein